MSNKKGLSFFFTALATFFCVALVVSNIIAGKLWAAPFGLILTTGVWLFPIVYIVGDVIPEVYGLKVARKVILMGFLINLVMIGFYFICLKLTPPPFWTNQEAFQTVLGFTPRLLLASFLGYLVGSNANAWVLVAVKKFTNGRFLWLRTITSTIVGESLDSVVFVSVAFIGLMPGSAIDTTILSMAGFKIAYEVLATPLTYLVVNWVKKVEKVDQYA